jgi:hypothetical protein
MEENRRWTRVHEAGAVLPGGITVFSFLFSQAFYLGLKFYFSLRCIVVSSILVLVPVSLTRRTRGDTDGK